MPGVRISGQGPASDALASALLQLWAQASGSTLILFDKAGNVVAWSSHVPEHRAAMISDEGLHLVDQSGDEPAPGARPVERVLAEGIAVLDEVWLFPLEDRRHAVFVDCWPIQQVGGAMMMLTTPRKWAVQSRVQAGLTIPGV